jgi:hypothetical protein
LEAQNIDSPSMTPSQLETMSYDMRDCELQLRNDLHKKIEEALQISGVREARRLSRLVPMMVAHRRSWWRAQIRDLAERAGEHTGRSNNARIGAWKAIRNSLRSEEVQLGLGYTEEERRRLLEYTEWLVEALQTDPSRYPEWATPVSRASD